MNKYLLKASSILFYAAVFTMFFLLPKYYEVHPIMKLNEYVKWLALVFAVVDFFVFFVFSMGEKPLEKPKF